jgi:large subunit ribosomal protein L6
VIPLNQATITINDRQVTVKGPKGELKREIPELISVEVNDGVVTVTRANDSKPARALHGLIRSLVANMVEGVNNGFTKSLDLVGVGYKASVAGSRLTLNVGYSHPVEIDAPAGVSVETETPTKLLVKGIDKEAVGNLAAKIRAVRKPEPYKGKGIKYSGEVIRRKAGKAK